MGFADLYRSTEQKRSATDPTEQANVSGGVWKMNSQEFVELLQRGVFEGGVEDTKQVLEDPPGKRPSPALVELSDWYKGLPPEGQAAAVEVARLTARYCVFGFLTLLDGVALFPTEGKRGTFKLSLRGRWWRDACQRSQTGDSCMTSFDRWCLRSNQTSSRLGDGLAARPATDRKASGHGSWFDWRRPPIIGQAHPPLDWTMRA